MALDEPVAPILDHGLEGNVVQGRRQKIARLCRVAAVEKGKTEVGDKPGFFLQAQGDGGGGRIDGGAEILDPLLLPAQKLGRAGPAGIKPRRLRRLEVARCRANRDDPQLRQPLLIPAPVFLQQADDIGRFLWRRDERRPFHIGGNALGLVDRDRGAAP